MIRARQTCVWGLLRFPTTASRRTRWWGDVYGDTGADRTDPNANPAEGIDNETLSLSTIHWKRKDTQDGIESCVT